MTEKKLNLPGVEKKKTLDGLTQEQQGLLKNMIEGIMNEYKSKDQQKIDLLFEKVNDLMTENEQARDMIRGLIGLIREIDEEKITAFMQKKSEKAFNIKQSLEGEKENIS